MLVSVQARHLRMVMKENEEDLALFLDLQKREMETENLNIVQNNDEFDGCNPGSSPKSNIVSSVPARKNATEEFLNSENGKADYDWLLAPHGPPFPPSLEMDTEKSILCPMGIPNTRPIAIKSRLVNSLPEPLSKSKITSRQASSSPVLTISSAGNRRSSSGGRASTNCRPSTPTGRPTLPAIAKSSRPSTPTSRPTMPSTIKATTSGVRSSTPTRSTARSSTPTARISVPASKPTSKSATPTRRPSTPSSIPSVSGPPHRSSSVTKSAPAAKNSILSRGISPPVKSRPWKPSEMPGFSVDAPPNLRTSMSEWPSSVSKGRPGAPNVRPSSIEAAIKGNLRQQSCSPSRGQATHGSVYGNGSLVPVRSRAHSNSSESSDHVSPVLIGTQMVDRVVNMRKLAQPKQDDRCSTHGNSAGKSSSSLDSSGFGRTLSKKSLDMAVRHMDIRRSISGNLRPIMTKIPASSMYSVRSGDSKSRTLSVSDSPLATSSNASSEPSVNYNSNYLDGSEVGDDDIGSERGMYSLVSHQGR